MLSKMSNRTFTICVLVLIGGFATVTVGVNRFGWFQFAENETEVAEREEAEATPVQRFDSHLTGEYAPGPGYEMVGGVWRKQEELQESQAPEETDEHPGLGRLIGSSPIVPVDSNETTEALGQALENDDAPWMVSEMIPPPEFDRDTYLADPESYLAIAPPGRVWQAAQPGDGVARIQRISAAHRNVVQGDTVTLQVKAEPGMPVTFYTPHLGEFPNRLKSISVQANEEGIAETQFTATTGTYGDVGVLAASPTNSGQARFLVNVSLPRDTVQIGD